ncbi:MAG TPA: hypothetical protein VNM37_23725, partial [Candidatus Dormibacteraeota bacterium]|nr:hypothetical protein [Candidatus Dormibacteraeota bacterium]
MPFPRGLFGVWTPLLFVVGLCLVPAVRAQSAGVAGQPGQATGLETFNFADLSERERLENVPMLPKPRPALQRSVAIRGSRASVLPPTSPVRPAENPPANPGREGDWGFTPAADVVPSPAPSASFQALPDDDTVFEPDTSGAVGPNHLMVTLASQVRVQDRFGGALQTISLRSFWGVSGPTNVYDPRVLYDRAAQRWVVTANANPGTNNSSLLIAVSQTGDPTGNWTRRAVRTDQGSAVFPDLPNVGLSRDWITVTANMYDKTNYAYFSCDIWVFDKANLYAGGAGQFTFFRYLDARLAEASVLVPSVNEDNGTTNMLVSNYDGNLATEDGTFGYLRLFSITGPVGAEVFNDFSGPGGTNGNFVGLFTPWTSFPPYFNNFAPQQGTGARVYIGDARIQNVVYRNGFLWLCQHVFFPTTLPQHTAVQWLSITPGGAIDQVGYLNDPSGIKSYAYPSLAVNNDGDVLIGFSSFSINQFPSAGYVFHAYADGGGALRDESILKAGEDTFFIDDAGVNH